VTIALEKMQNVKKEMRRNIAKILKNCSVQEIETQSLQLSRKVLQFPLFQHAKAISIYLEMAQEASTKHIIQAAFEQGKHVYVPKIVGKGAEDLKMLRAYSLQDIQTFPKVSPNFDIVQLLYPIMNINRTNGVYPIQR
jgi:5,10-methenyltetrahydrofolate synthetase